MLTHYNKWEKYLWPNYTTWAWWLPHYAATSEAQIAADRVWQAAFDGVLAGVDEELIAGVAVACDVARLDNQKLYNSDIVYACLNNW